MALRRRHDVIIIAAIALAAIAYGASRSEFRLRPDMPVEFFDASHLAPQKRAAEEKIARAYWNSAVKQVQWKYGYGSRLPIDPPPDFSVSTDEIGPVAKDEAVRRHYWEQLRAAWNLSSAWKTQYELSSISFRQTLRSGGEWWGQVTRNMFGR
jgi:hypothetical protein